MSTRYVSTYGGWINAASTESDCLVQKLAAPAAYTEKPSTLLQRTLVVPELAIDNCFVNLVPVLIRLFDRVDVAKLLDCCRSRI